MRRAAALLTPLILAAVLVFVLDPFSAGEAPAPAPAGRDGPGPAVSASAPTPSPDPPPVRLEPLPAAPGLPEDLSAALAEARGLLAEGRLEEAATLLEGAQRRHPEATERPEFQRVLARVRAAAAPAPAAPARPQTPRTRYAASRAIADLATTAGGRAHLRRHVERFVPREGGDPGPATAGESTLDEAESEEGENQEDGIEAAFQVLLGDRAAWRRDAPGVPLVDVEATETRRVEQLERLAQRGATELLDPLHGALVWLTLHQGDDGHFSNATVNARCEALGHGKTERKRRRKQDCLRIFGGGKPVDRDPVGSTALALLALLDFRDQDARAVFEPHLGRAIDWLLAQQRPDGTFGKTPGNRQYYATAITLMALAQAAASSGRDDLKQAVARGLAGLYAAVGRHGGYRYGRNAPGDLSVSGWVAQAVEAARWAEIETPDRMDLDLRYFLDSVWLGKERFAYLVGYGGKRETLYPVGMLMGHILWDEIGDETLAAWRTWSAERAGKLRLERKIYSLYYGVRVCLLLEDGLVDPWKTYVNKLVEMQVRTGPSAGMFKRDVGQWVRDPVVTTALAALTLEHALYER